MTYLITKYLQKANPEKLDQLRALYPRAEDVLRIDVILGSNDVRAAEADPNRGAKIDLIRESAERLLPDIESLIKSIRSKSARVNRLRFGGGLVAAVSGFVGALVAFFGQKDGSSESSIVLISAATSMVAGLIAAFADHLEKSETGARYSPTETLPTLVDSRATANKALRSLSRDAVFPLSGSDIESIIAELDRAAEEVIRLKYLAT